MSMQGTALLSNFLHSQPGLTTVGYPNLQGVSEARDTLKDNLASIGLAVQSGEDEEVLERNDNGNRLEADANDQASAVVGRLLSLEDVSSHDSGKSTSDSHQSSAHSLLSLANYFIGSVKVRPRFAE